MTEPMPTPAELDPLAAMLGLPPLAADPAAAPDAVTAGGHRTGNRLAARHRDDRLDAP